MIHSPSFRAFRGRLPPIADNPCFTKWAQLSCDGNDDQILTVIAASRRTSITLNNNPGHHKVLQDHNADKTPASSHCDFIMLMLPASALSFATAELFVLRKLGLSGCSLGFGGVRIEGGCRTEDLGVTSEV